VRGEPAYVAVSERGAALDGPYATRGGAGDRGVASGGREGGAVSDDRLKAMKDALVASAVDHEQRVLAERVRVLEAALHEALDGWGETSGCYSAESRIAELRKLAGERAK
jgi:hypothetical protein